MVVHITIPRTHGERMRLPKMVYEPSALDSKSVQKAKILSASMVNAGRTFRSKATSYSVYEVEVKGAGIDKIVPKRWSDFVVFDETWRRLYPNVHNIYYLPKDTLMSLVAKNSYGVTAYRREGLEVYLQGLSKVSAITPLLEAFLELPPNTLQRKKGQSAKQLRSGLNTANTENKGELVKVLSPEELSAKGNTDMAALKAHQQHERFVAQHEGILASLMPGRQLNLNPKAFLLVGDAKSHHINLGEIRASVFFDPDGGKTPARSRSNSRVGEPNSPSPTPSVSKGKLIVELYRARDIAISSSKLHLTADSYAKVYLKPDPDHRTKLKTAVVMKSQNPVYNEAFEYIMPFGDLDSKTVEISVWGKGAASAGGVGIGQCLGLVCIAGSDVPRVPRTSRPAPVWYKLSPPDYQIETKMVQNSIRSGAVIKPPPGKAPEANKMDPYSDAARRLRWTPPQGEYAKKEGDSEPASGQTSLNNSQIKNSAGFGGSRKASFRTGEAIKSYIPHPDEANSVLNLTKGEAIELLDTTDSEWWLVRIRGKAGYVPADCVRER